MLRGRSEAKAEEATMNLARDLLSKISAPCSRWRPFLGVIIVLCSASSASAQREHVTRFEGAERHIYKRVDDVALSLNVFRPEASGPRPAIVFFFGGGWRAGSPSQFEPHARHWQARGLVTVLVDYRVASRHETTPIEAVKDARSAMRFVRQNAERLGVDPRRIVASGGSAGGHLAAAAALASDVNEGTDPVSVSARPNALILFNPALDLLAFAPSDRRLRRRHRAHLSPAAGRSWRASHSRAARYR